MTFNIYAILSLTRNYIYVGMTQNLKQRVIRHNNGGEKTTKPYKPFKLIFIEKVEGSRRDAKQREKYWKSVVGKEKLKTIKNIEIDLNSID